MRKTILALSAICMAAPAFADQSFRGQVKDIYKDVTTEIPRYEEVCRHVKVPIYRDKEVVRKGNAGEGALLGMIVGGVLGKVITNDDKGAAAGAIIGGVAGADNANEKVIERQIIDYEYEKKCETITKYDRKITKKYSHSEITFYHDGNKHTLEFIK